MGSNSRQHFFCRFHSGSIYATAEVVEDVEKILHEESPVHNKPGENRLASAVSFIGTGGPRLMLTQEPEYPSPYYAMVLVNTSDAKYTEDYAKSVRERLSDYMDARITVDQFMLGPPIKDPVAFRLTGPDRDLVGNPGTFCHAITLCTDGGKIGMASFLRWY